MRVLVAAVLLQVAGAKGLRRGLSTDVDVDVDDSATNVVNAGGDMGADTGMDLEQSVVSWIPIKPAGQRVLTLLCPLEYGVCAPGVLFQPAKRYFGVHPSERGSCHRCRPNA
mmetsp:Transcript_87273/g.199235  ORF Transcript_87273/g.199235 Transcript_87273/m.199235 type:complete len:112 (+) Transcript_87273:94-429(+)